MARKRRARGRPEISSELAAKFGVKVPEEKDGERYLSPNEIGKIMNCTGEAVKQWIYHRRLPAVKLMNGYWKVRVRDLEAFLQQRQEIGKRKVLITANNGAMQVAVDTVKELGHEVIVANGFADALLKALNVQPSLFLVDVSADEPWKLMEKIRSTKALRKIPILLFADAELKEAEAESALKLAIQGFIKRPTNKDSIAKEVQSALSW